MSTKINDGKLSVPEFTDLYNKKHKTSYNTSAIRKWIYAGKIKAVDVRHKGGVLASWRIDRKELEKS